MACVALALACGATLGCSQRAPREVTVRPADQLVLYEGLPHQSYERDALEQERKTKPTVVRHGFPFYRETLDLEAHDGPKLKALLGDPNTFKTYSGEKKCGGFHPDYALEWTHEGRVWTVLICFSCKEARIYEPRGESIVDIRRDAFDRLHALLSTYRKNRPPHEGVGP